MAQSAVNPCPVPTNEAERLSTLYAYHILDSEPEAGFDRAATLAAGLFCAPIGLISLVDADRQWFKAKCGLAVNQTPRDLSFCAYAILEPGPMVVCDATQDVRFLDNPLVTGEMSIRFYVGAPVLSKQGLPLGTLCVIDTVARERPTPQQLNTLVDLAFLVGEMLEFRSAVITNRATEKRHQEQLERARNAAVEANRAKSDFLARMSHEIRTPINLIMGMNALLLESTLDEKQRERVGISHRNVKRLLRLINGILDLSKVEAGELVFQAVPFDLGEVLKECVGTISTVIEQNGIEFEVFIDFRAWRYWVGDAERLQQVLLNVIGNSIKFTSAGKINVKVCAQQGPQDQPGLRFEVNDSGCGVPPEKASLIFDAFQQGEESMSRSYEGTGLGLSMARTLVERMSGKIWLAEKSEPGAKFIFTVFLPKSTEEAVRDRNSAEAQKIPPGWASGACILLVEDNPDNVILMQSYLENLSVPLDLAANGLEALEKRQRNNYDLILMDIQMPIMDGYTSTRRIRNWEATHRMERVPIVAVTAHAFSGASADSLEAGCDWHLTKPVERRDVLDAIAKFARPHRSDQEKEEISHTIQARRPAYLSKRHDDLKNMRAALASGDFALIQTIGHNFKGTGNGYGFPKISSLGLEIESGAKERDGTKIADWLGHFEQYLESVSEAQYSDA